MTKNGRRHILTINNDNCSDIVSHRFLTQTGRPNLTAHPPSELSLHWIHFTTVDGGQVRGRTKSKWAVSTDGRWMGRLREPSCVLKGQAEEVWQHWGHLEGGGRAGPSEGEGRAPLEHHHREEDTGNAERSTYVSRRLAVSPNSTDTAL